MTAVATEIKQEITITGDRDDLLATLVPAERFTSRHTSAPSIQNFHIVADGSGDTWLETTDLSMSFRGKLWGIFDPPQAELIVSPRLRRAVAAMAPGGVTLKRADGSGELEVRGSGRARYTVPLGSGEFPPLPGLNAIEWESLPSVSAREALEAMGVAARFVAKGEQNPSITGVNLRHHENSLVVSATDGVRMVELRVSLPAQDFPFGENDVTLPVRMVQELTRLFPDGELKLTADANSFYAAAPNGGTFFQSRRIDGKFPDLSAVLPPFTNTMELPREELRNALRRINSVGGGSVLEMMTKDGAMRLRLRGGDGEGEEWVDHPAKEPLTIGFNVEGLLSGVELFSGDTVQLAYSTPLRPAMLTADGEGRKLVIMPVRLA